MHSHTDRSPVGGPSSKTFRIAVLALSVGILLMIVKFIAYSMTGSLAIMSDAIESIVNVLASSFALMSISVSASPPDKNHPYGHGRIEYFSSGFEGLLILIAACAMVWIAVQEIFDPKEIVFISEGLLLVGIAGAVNAITGGYMQVLGRSLRSPALIADGKHLMSDAITSAGILISVALIAWTDWYILDPIIALIVGLWICFTGISLLKSSVSRLMNEVDIPTLEKVIDILQRNRKSYWIDVHCLRAWESGPKVHIDFHLVLPRYWNLEKAHETENEIETILENSGLDTDVMLHLDPCTSSYCKSCRVDDCPVREHAFTRNNIFTVSEATQDRHVKETHD